MAKKLWLAVLVLCLMGASAAQMRHAERSTQRGGVQLVQIGVRSTNGVHTPLWAVMMGDTTAAEQFARRFKALGPHSLNATVWTHDEDSAGWLRTTFIRPRDIDEAVDLHNDPQAFTLRKTGGVGVLPPQFWGITADLMERIDFIIRYEDDGSAKAYLYPYTSREDAEQLVAVLSENE